MVEPVIVRKGTSPTVINAGGGAITTVVHPDTVMSVSSFACIGEIDPGKSPHRWHNHVRDDSPQVEIIYPEGFEEYYYVIRGSGVVQWRLADGTVREEPIDEGELVFFPVGVAEHQLVNTGDSRMILFAGGGPPTRRVWKSLRFD